METTHVPVLLAEAVSYLNCQVDGIYVDATVGSGGHAFKILNDYPAIKKLIAIDWDSDAITRARSRLEQFSEKVCMVQDTFASLRSIARKLNIEKINGILLDLGVSSHQLENPERGFSFQHKGPLDMRMSTDILSATAYDIVNTASAAELKDMFHTYGEERWASRIARTIVARRKQEPVSDTMTLSNLITASIPPRFRSRTIHPATRTFQALRIAVNHELHSLRQVIADGIDLLAAGGRICVISFHSLEDRIVKREFNQRARCHGRDDGVSSGSTGETPVIQIITRKPVIAQSEELQHNPRARSAKLRVAEKL